MRGAAAQRRFKLKRERRGRELLELIGNFDVDGDHTDVESDHAEEEETVLIDLLEQEQPSPLLKPSPKPTVKQPRKLPLETFFEMARDTTVQQEETTVRQQETTVRQQETTVQVTRDTPEASETVSSDDETPSDSESDDDFVHYEYDLETRLNAAWNVDDFMERSTLVRMALKYLPTMEVALNCSAVSWHFLRESLAVLSSRFPRIRRSEAKQKVAVYEDSLSAAVAATHVLHDTKDMLSLPLTAVFDHNCEHVQDDGSVHVDLSQHKVRNMSLNPVTREALLRLSDGVLVLISWDTTQSDGVARIARCITRDMVPMRHDFALQVDWRSRHICVPHKDNGFVVFHLDRPDEAFQVRYAGSPYTRYWIEYNGSAKNADISQLEVWIQSSTRTCRNVFDRERHEFVCSQQAPLTMLSVNSTQNVLRASNRHLRAVIGTTGILKLQSIRDLMNGCNTPVTLNLGDVIRSLHTNKRPGAVTHLAITQTHSKTEHVNEHEHTIFVQWKKRPIVVLRVIETARSLRILIRAVLTDSESTLLAAIRPGLCILRGAWRKVDQVLRASEELRLRHGKLVHRRQWETGKGPIVATLSHVSAINKAQVASFENCTGDHCDFISHTVETRSEYIFVPPLLKFRAIDIEHEFLIKRDDHREYDRFFKRKTTAPDSIPLESDLQQRFEIEKSQCPVRPAVFRRGAFLSQLMQIEHELQEAQIDSHLEPERHKDTVMCIAASGHYFAVATPRLIYFFDLCGSSNWNAHDSVAIVQKLIANREPTSRQRKARLDKRSRVLEELSESHKEQQKQREKLIDAVVQRVKHAVLAEKCALRDGFGRRRRDGFKPEHPKYRHLRSSLVAKCTTRAKQAVLEELGEEFAVLSRSIRVKITDKEMVSLLRRTEAQGLVRVLDSIYDGEQINSHAVIVPAGEWVKKTDADGSSAGAKVTPRKKTKRQRRDAAAALRKTAPR